MNRKQRKRLAKEIECSANYNGNLAVISYFVQVRPWTHVAITYFDGPKLEDAIIGHGFTKVDWPDKWSPTYGRNLAVEKAAAHIVRQMGERAETIFEILGITEITEKEEIVVGENWAGPVQGILDVEHAVPVG